MLFPCRKPEVRLLKNTAAGVIFSVKSGKGFLRQCVTYDPHPYGLIRSLCWQDVPLIRFWSEADCPTCAEFVYSGFADNEQGAARFLSALENWNRPWSGMTDAFATLTPLFSCLADGYYLLEDRELYPTDGNGHFFWAATDHSSIIQQPLPSGIRNIALSVTPRPAFFYPASRHHILILSVRRFIAINRTPALWPGISLIPIYAFYSTDTIKPLPPRWKVDRSKPWCSARQLVLMMSSKPWYFRAGNFCTKQSCNTASQNSPRGKNCRPAHGIVSALIST